IHNQGMFSRLQNQRLLRPVYQKLTGYILQVKQAFWQDNTVKLKLFTADFAQYSDREKEWLCSSRAKNRNRCVIATRPMTQLQDFLCGFGLNLKLISFSACTTEF